MLRPLTHGAACVACLTLALHQPSAAETFTWTQADGGLFTEPTNWDPPTGPPGATDDAVFDLPGTYTASLPEPGHTVNSVDIPEGNVSLASDVLFGSSTFSTNGAVHINTDGVDTALLDVKSSVSLAALGGVTLGPGGGLSIASNTGLTVGGTSLVDVAADLDLNANGRLTLLPGALMTINQQVFDWDGVVVANTQTNIQNGAVLNMHAGRIDGANDVFEAEINIHGGTLHVDNNADRWTMRGELNIDGSTADATIAGVQMEARNSITTIAAGTARFAAPLDVNNAIFFVDDDATIHLDAPADFDAMSTLILSDTGSLHVNSETTIRSASFDWDGESETGTRTTLDPGAVLHINTDTIDAEDDTFNATININDAELHVDNLADGWTIAGAVNFSGIDTPAVVGGDPVRLTGTFDVSGDQGAVFRAPVVVDPAATWSGGARVTTENTLTLLDGVAIPLPVYALGAVHVGSSPGTATLAQLDMGADASLNIELQTPAGDPGTEPAPGVDHDRLNVTGTVALDGELALHTLSGPEDPPALGTAYHVLTYASRDGMFAGVADNLINTSLAWAPLLTDTDGDMADDTLVLRASIPGDLNLDNQVSVADLSTFALNFNTTPGLYVEAEKMNSWELGDFNADGAITVADLSLLALNFGFGVVEGEAGGTGLSVHELVALAGIDPSGVPEPTAVSVMLGAILACCRRTRPAG